MIASLLVLPIVVPLATAALAMAAWRLPRVQAALSVLGAALLLLCALLLLEEVRVSGIRATQIGAWPAPFGITFVADLLAAIMVLLTGLIGLAVVVYSLADVDPARQAFGFHPLVQVLLAGVSGAFLTGDIFNLFVWFEVMLISSFVLLALGGERAQLEGSIKYVALNLVSSALFLAAVGILYGLAGTLNMADLTVELAGAPRPAFFTAAGMLLLVAFGIKAAIFPLFFWLPASYHTPPAAVSALFAGLLTKVGVYAMIRVFTLIFTGEPQLTHRLILWLAGLTMLTGVLGAVAQSDLRRILSFHIISQIGYMVMGLGLYAPLALAGSIFYIAHHIIVKSNLFLVSGLVRHLGGSSRLERLGGLYRERPALAVAFLIPALSLAGLPPLSGFFAKLVLIRAGVEQRSIAIVVVALLVGLLTLFSMMKIWNGVFWMPAPEERPPPARGRRCPPLMFAPVVALASITVAIGVWPSPLLSLATQAAEQLMDPQRYVRAVLDAGGGGR